MDTGVANGIYVPAVPGLFSGAETGISRGLANGVFNENMLPAGIIKSGMLSYLDAGNPYSYPGSGTTWYDLSGNGKNGTLVNGAVYDFDKVPNISFDGVNDYVSLGTFTGLGNSGRSLFCWVKVTKNPNNVCRIITFPQDDTATDSPAMLIGYKYAFGGYSFEVGGAPSYLGGTQADRYICNWICLALTITSKTVRGFINGSFIGTGSTTDAVPSNPIGYLGRYNNYYGQYDAFKISIFVLYNRALSDSEIAQNYMATKSRFGL